MVDTDYLLDTGFLVALADKRDPDHEDCRTAWGRIRGRLATVEGVLVEAAHLVRRNPGGFDVVYGLVTSVEAEIVPTTRARYQRAQELMRQYHDIPMDLVDALLVALAEERGVSNILTLDERGFRSYRMRGRRKFTLIPPAPFVY